MKPRIRVDHRDMGFYRYSALVFVPRVLPCLHIRQGDAEHYQTVRATSLEHLRSAVDEVLVSWKALGRIPT